jgi:2-polyprenyl-3-methyl-5-hydroxy-6-metoxy-1,4-benzoquinol methylase
MLSNFLQSILVDPLNGEPLDYLPEQNNLSGKINSYPVVENVPILIKPAPYYKETNSPLHNNIGSQFQYLEHYEKDAELFDYFEEDKCFATAEERKRSREMIISKVDKNCSAILDIGCGSAWVAKHFLPLQKKVVSMDISKKKPVTALKNFPHPNHSAIVADVFNMPLKKNSFDTIIASEVIEHVFDPKLFIEKISTVLKPGGN